ncbi:MAG TPA: SRPBCC domain-containing protein [Vicinamibacterales bacterium]|nr:SRPBCC domain-containing protein [Vicinamibacterales bacterium]
MTLTATLPHRLERTITIAAEPETVFRFFTDSARWAAWWGAGSTIDARPGGRFLIRNPGGVEASGTVVDIDVPTRLVLTYGYNSGTPIPPDASRVTIRLVAERGGTRLSLLHEFAEAHAAARDEHVQGWRFQLSLFSNAVADEVYADATSLVDRWFTAWSDADAASRTSAVENLTEPSVQFRDRFSAIEGRDELLAHLAAAQRFMPGLRMERASDVRHCQGMAIADWVARAADGAERSRGTNVFAFANRRIASVTGFWAAHPMAKS